MEKIESERTVLRRFVRTDVNNMQILEADPEVMEFTPRVPQTVKQTSERLEKWIAKQVRLEPFGLWAAELKRDFSFLGWFMLMPDDNKQLALGFMIAKAYWNKGFATEVCQSLINLARTQGRVECIVAKANAENLRSIRTLEKLGFFPTDDIFVPDKLSEEKVRLKTFKLSFDF